MGAGSWVSMQGCTAEAEVTSTSRPWSRSENCKFQSKGVDQHCPHSTGRMEKVRVLCLACAVWAEGAAASRVWSQVAL